MLYHDNVYETSYTHMVYRYIKRETWRKEYNGGQGLDHVLETFDFSKERAQLATIYPQYYHQTDKVCLHHPNLTMLRDDD